MRIKRNLSTNKNTPDMHGTTIQIQGYSYHLCECTFPIQLTYRTAINTKIVHHECFIKNRRN